MAVCIKIDQNDLYKVKSLKQYLYVMPEEKVFVKNKYSSQSTNNSKGVYVYNYTEDKALKQFYFMLPLNYFMTNFNKNNEYKEFPGVRMKFTGSLYPIQKIYANKTIDYLNKYRSVTLCPIPGFGKTTISIAVSCKIGCLTLVIMYNNGKIIEQWAECYRQRTTASVWVVGEKHPPDVVDVIICMHTRTKLIPKALRDKVCLMLIDEGHQLANQTGINALLDFEPKYIICCTATPVKRNGMDLAVRLIVGNETVGSEIPVPKFKLIKVTTNYTGERVINNHTGGPVWSILNQSFLYNHDRNVNIILLSHILALKGRKLLVFTTEVDHAAKMDQIYKTLKSQNTTSDYITAKKPKYKDSNILFGNMQMCGTGFDESMYCEDFSGKRINTIIFASSFRDKANLFQCVGRALRSDNPLVLHIVDNDKTIKKQWGICNEWYREHCSSTTVINLEETISSKIRKKDESYSEK